MKARPPVARVSGRALRVVQRGRGMLQRRWLALSWRDVRKAAVQTAPTIAHRHRHVHAWSVAVHVARQPDLAQRVGARVTAFPAIPRKPARTRAIAPLVHATSHTSRTMVERTLRHLQMARVERHSIDTIGTLQWMRDSVATPRRRAGLLPSEVFSRGTRAWPSVVSSAVPARRAAVALPDGARVHARTATPAVAPRTTTPHAAPRRELVWQTPSQSRDRANAAEAPAATAAQHADRSASRAPPAPAEIANAAAAHLRTSAMTWPEPDRAAFDRLANEVMRRVEKGLRIERERRGR